MRIEPGTPRFWGNDLNHCTAVWDYCSKRKLNVVHRLIKNLMRPCFLTCHGIKKSNRLNQVLANVAREAHYLPRLFEFGNYLLIGCRVRNWSWVCIYCCFCFQILVKSMLKNHSFKNPLLKNAATKSSKTWELVRSHRSIKFTSFHIQVAKV